MASSSILKIESLLSVLISLPRTAVEYQQALCYQNLTFLSSLHSEILLRYFIYCKEKREKC